MGPQTAIRVESGTNYVQLRIRGEPEPFFFAIDEAHSNAGALIGTIVDGEGKCLQPNASVERSQIVQVTRAILSEGDFPLLIPVKPIKPRSGRR